MVFTPSVGGSTELLVPVAIINDNLLETNEIFTLELSTTAERVTFTQSTATATIMDDDGIFNAQYILLLSRAVLSILMTLYCILVEVNVSLEQGSYTVEEAVGSMNVCLVLSGELGRDITVTLETSDNSATSKYCLSFHRFAVL